MTSSKLISFWVRCFVLGCLFAGPALFLTGAGFAVHEWWFIRHADKTQATVTNLVAVQNDEDHSTYYCPVFTFKTSDGVTHTIQSSAGSNPPGFGVGQEVTVLFNPANPENASINSVGQLWLFPIVFGAVGLTAFSVGLWGRSRFRRNTPLVPDQLSASASSPIEGISRWSVEGSLAIAEV